MPGLEIVLPKCGIISILEGFDQGSDCRGESYAFRRFDFWQISQ
jgi:hypothetical protein